jgi:hypothetical protein
MLFYQRKDGEGVPVPQYLKVHAPRYIPDVADCYLGTTSSDESGDDVRYAADGSYGADEVDIDEGRRQEGQIRRLMELSLTTDDVKWARRLTHSLKVSSTRCWSHLYTKNLPASISKHRLNAKNEKFVAALMKRLH